MNPPPPSPPRVRRPPLTPPPPLSALPPPPPPLPLAAPRAVKERLGSAGWRAGPSGQAQCEPPAAHQAARPARRPRPRPRPRSAPSRAAGEGGGARRGARGRGARAPQVPAAARVRTGPVPAGGPRAAPRGAPSCKPAPSASPGTREPAAAARLLRQWGAAGAHPPAAFPADPLTLPALACPRRAASERWGLEEAFSLEAAVSSGLKMRPAGSGERCQPTARSGEAAGAAQA